MTVIQFTIIVSTKWLVFFSAAAVISKCCLDEERDAESGTETVSVVKKGMAFGVRFAFQLLT